MNGFFDQSGALKEFAGAAPLFPLPNLVAFPYGLIPLHIFEGRYRQMIADALAGNRLMVLARLREGHEDLYHTREAPIYQTACLGKIAAPQELPDGRYCLVFEGLVRVSIEEEITSEVPYRVAKLKLHKDRHRFSPGFDASLQTRRLLEICKNHLAGKFDLKPLMTILGTDVKLGPLCDLIAHLCSFSLERKQTLLEEFSVEKRSQRLMLCLQQLLSEELAKDAGRPPFSQN